jgi:hypothetical protein
MSARQISALSSTSQGRILAVNPALVAALLQREATDDYSQSQAIVDDYSQSQAIVDDI